MRFRDGIGVELLLVCLTMMMTDDDVDIVVGEHRGLMHSERCTE